MTFPLLYIVTIINLSYSTDGISFQDNVIVSRYYTAYFHFAIFCFFKLISFHKIVH